LAENPVDYGGNAITLH